MSQRYFQWVVSERKGEVVVFDKIIQEDNMTFIEFKDNSRINAELVAEINETQLDGKMVAEVSDPNNIWKFEEVKDDDQTRVEQDWESQIKYEVPSVDDLVHADLTGQEGVVNPRKKKKKIKLIPPRPTINKFGKIANSNDLAENYNESIKNEVKVEEKAPEKPSVSSDDPVYIMMEKSKKVDTEVSMTLNISLPSKRLFEVASESFEDGAKKTLEYIIDNIDISEIKNSLKIGIEQFYEVTPEAVVANIVDVLKDDEFPRYPEQIHEDKEVKTNELGEPIAVEEPIVKAGVPQGDPSILSE